MGYIDDFFKERSIIQYERDGILDSIKWCSSKSRILYVLKETAGYQDCKDFDLIDEVSRWIRDKVPTYTKIAKLTMLLEISISSNKVLSDSEIDNISFSYEELKEHIKFSSIININKQSVKRKSSDRLVYKKYCENYDLLKYQVEQIQPSIVIAGSTICWKCVSFKTNGLFKDYDIKNLNKHCATIDKGLIFYHANHPSAWTSGGFNVRKVYRDIMNIVLCSTMKK